MSFSKKDYIEYVKPLAKIIEGAMQIPMILPITQSAHESNFGNSELSSRDNNYFGMTRGDVWAGEVSTWPSTEFSKLPPDKIKYWNHEGDILSKRDDGKGGTILRIGIDFRKYPSALDSFSDWGKHIETLYPLAYAAAKQNDLVGFFTEVGKKYGTDGHYTASCLDVLKTIQTLI